MIAATPAASGATQGAKPLPLDGIRVVDFSRLLPGPWATQMLGELGADIIKVEQPGIGDPSRHSQPRFNNDSVYFNAVNTDKRSIALDLTQDAGREVAHRLLRDADVVVESYRPGVAKKLGVDYAAIRNFNARVIYCSISGFGQTGPLSHIAGHDLVIQGMTGLMGCALEAANPPAVPGFQAGDFAGALMTVIGVQAALAQRTRSGEGCMMDIAMFDALFNMCAIPLTPALGRLAGHSGEPRQEVFGRNPRYSTYVTKDGKPVAVSLLETKAWQEFCNIIGRPDLVFADETPADRLTAHGERHALYRAAIAGYCASHSHAEITRHMEKTGVAICPVCTPDEAVALPDVAARGLIDYLQHPVEGRVPHLVNPLTRAGLARAVHRPAPGLGEHADEILTAAGYTQKEITELRQRRII